MENEADNKFTWVINNFSSLQSEFISSEPFVIGGCRWCLIAYPKGNKIANKLALYLDVVDYESLPCGWKRHVKVSFTILNQNSINLSKVREMQKWYNENDRDWGCPNSISLTQLHAKDKGFLVNGQLKIVVAITVLEVIGKLDVPVESQESNQPLKKIKLEDCVESKDLLKETIDVNGFHVLPSQVEIVKRIFRLYPNFSSNICVKNRQMMSTYMNVVLGVINTLCQLPVDLTDDDLNEVCSAVSFVAKAGFKLDWLEKMLNEVKAKKKNLDFGKARLQQMEQEMKKYNQICSDLKALMENVKADVLVANLPLSFNDVNV